MLVFNKNKKIKTEVVDDINNIIDQVKDIEFLDKSISNSIAFRLKKVIHKIEKND
jgi:hypothetical protein